MDTNFSKIYSQVTPAEWDDLYQFRAAHGKFFSPTIHDGVSLKAMFLQSRNEEAAAKQILEKMGYSVSYNDTLRDVVYALPQENNAVPDLACLSPKSGKTMLVEVKNIKFTASTHLRMKFNLWIKPGEYTSKQDVIDAIWKYDFHNANYVMFITPDLKTYGFIRKKDIYVKDADVPNLNIRGKAPVVFYADVYSWRNA